jgi:uncharacterized protein with beta-barrel porin domain
LLNVGFELRDPTRTALSSIAIPSSFNIRSFDPTVSKLNLIFSNGEIQALVTRIENVATGREDITPSAPLVSFVPPTLEAKLPIDPPSTNQVNVATGLDRAINSGATAPTSFIPLYFLTDVPLENAMTQLSGETATGAQRGAFQLTSQFLDTMLDPFVFGSGSIGRGPAMGFAAEREALPRDVTLAYAKAVKAPVYKAPPPLFDPHWSVWAGSYGGYNHTSGDPVGVGSHDVNARAFGVAGGFDYHFSPDTVAGFALAGGGTNWSLAQGLGGGRSDAFQAGVYAKTFFGPAYIGGSLGFANHWMNIIPGAVVV